MNYQEWFEWWASRAPEYFTDKAWTFSQPDLIDRLKIQKTDAVLEIGFGYGRELSQFCGLSDNVWGLELTDWACKNTLLELSERGVKPLPILSAYDGLTLPFFEKSFDVIYNCFVVQHLSREHARKMLQEALRLLTDKGQALFEFFGDPECYREGEDVFSGQDGAGGMFNNAYTAAEIPDLIAGAGGKLLWLETRAITPEWGNHWACFGKG